MIDRNAVRAAIVLIILLLAAFRGDAQEPSAAPQVVPPEAIQLLENPSFESGIYPWIIGCSRGRAVVTSLNPYDGAMNLMHTDASAFCWTDQWFDLSICQPGSVWVSFAYSIETPLPFEDGQAGRDRTDIWISDEAGHNVTPIEPYYTLFTRFDYDYTDEYTPILIRVDNLFDACTKCRLNIRTTINDYPLSVSVFAYDLVQVWCNPLVVVPEEYRVYLPGVLNSW